MKAACGNLLGSLMAQPLHGPRVLLLCGRLLPPGLVSAIQVPVPCSFFSLFPLKWLVLDATFPFLPFLVPITWLFSVVPLAPPPTIIIIMPLLVKNADDSTYITNLFWRYVFRGTSLGGSE